MGEGLIGGVLVTPLRRIANPKGDVLHAMKASSPGYAGFGEAYFSMILPGVVKGWKRHRKMTLNLVVPSGSVRFVIYDDRPGSPSIHRFQTVILGGTNHARLTVPPGLWMAFQGLGRGGSLLLNLADMEHDPAEADNQDMSALEFAWEGTYDDGSAQKHGR